MAGKDRVGSVTAKADFTDEEWQTIVEAPPGAGMLVVLASKGGMFRETFSMAKAYTEARQQHGQSELLDEIVSTKPKVDRSHHGSPEELEANALGHLRDAVALLEAKATPDEVDQYRRFVLSVTQHVAEAHKEDGQQVSDAEQAVIEKVAQALGGSGG
jgi:hypothetical protein